MDGYPVKSSIGIPRGSMLRIDDGAGILVDVWAGEIWLTQEGSGKDHMLRAGQRFRIDRSGGAIAHAFRRSVVSLASPARNIQARRIALLHPRGALPVVLHQRAGSRALRSLRGLVAGAFSPHPAVGTN
ncbi:MAG TPA: DUF2917 domain-containing protein [Burkholderiales bacterium]|jgi:hypothetical protein